MPATCYFALSVGMLPKLLRVVRASDGIRGTEQDPNRLTLILGENNTILEAFWE